ncbi:MAG: M24 family metallopeptidase [Actinomycetota bacterium]
MFGRGNVARMMAVMDHAARRQRLRHRLDELGLDSMLVSRLVNVRYLTGFTGSNGWVLLSGDGRDVVFTDPRYEEQSRREVPDLDRRIVGGGFAAAFAEAATGRVGFESAGLSHRAWRELDAAGGTELVPLDGEVERLRWAKDAEEIGLLQRAQAITDEAFERVIVKLAEGITEQRVAFELEVAMRERGAERVGFDTIVAFGPGAAEPHHRPTERPLRRGDAVKLDFGCVVEGYHSDMTRTVAFGEADQRLRELHELVLRAHLAGIEALRPGVAGGEVDAAARKVIEEAGHGGAFAHSLGHGVGLEIHEGPTLRRGSEDAVPAGGVVTVEPGVYLPGEGGVRIEDAVVVEEAGGRPLPATTKEFLVL